MTLPAEGGRVEILGLVSEQAAKLLGMEGWKFPKRAIKAFEEKRELARPVPEEVTMENLADFLGQGEYRHHYRIRNAFGDGTIFGDEDHGYDIYTICRKGEGICPKRGTRAARVEFWYTVNSLEAMLPETEVSIRVLHTPPMFHCPDHPDPSFTPREDFVNPKAALKRYLTGSGRLQAMLDQLESRRENVIRMGEGYLALNGDLRRHHAVRIPSGLRGIRWLDSEEEELEIDLEKFGPRVYFPDLTFDGFREAYPDQVEVLEDGRVLITMERRWVRCWLDKAGTLERVVIRSRFHLEVSGEDPIPLTRFLMMEFHLSRDQAEAAMAVSPRRSTKLSGQSGRSAFAIMRSRSRILVLEGSISAEWNL